MGFILHQHVFATFEEKEENKMPACMSYVGRIFRPRLIALFSFFFFSLSVYKILKVKMPKNISQSNDVKKLPTNTNFQAPASTGCKEEMASPNAAFPKQALVFKCLQYRSFETNLRKGEIAHNKLFLLFPQCFLPTWKIFCHFHQIQNCCLQLLQLGRV